MFDFGETDLGNRPTKHIPKGHISGWSSYFETQPGDMFPCFLFQLGSRESRLGYFATLAAFRGTSKLHPFLLKEAPPKRRCHIF